MAANTTFAGDPRQARTAGDAGDKRAAREAGPAGDPRPARVAKAGAQVTPSTDPDKQLPDPR